MSHGSVLIGTSEIRTAESASPRKCSIQDPFPRERVGSGDETSTIRASLTGHTLHLRRKGLVSCLYATCSSCYITEAANYVIFGNACNEYD